MSKKPLKGVIVALPTPLTSDEELDQISLQQLIEYAIAEGVHGLMVLGTMGEGTALMPKVRLEVIETAVETIRQRVPLLVTVSGSSTRKTIHNIQSIQQYPVDYLVCTSPYYYKFPDPESIINHVRESSEASSIPLIFYNAPGSTGNPVNCQTLDKILQLENVAGVKDSACQFREFAELLRKYPDPAHRPGTIMQGDESVYDASLLLGADGVVTGGGVLFISLLCKLFEAGKLKQIKEAVSLQHQFNQELNTVLQPDLARNWMHNIKRTLSERGIISSSTATAPFAHI